MEELDQLFKDAILADDAQTVKAIIYDMGISPNIWLSTDPDSLDTNGIQNLRTPLMMAAVSNSKKVFCELLGAGSDVNLRTNCGFTALHFACAERHDYIIDKLLQTKQCDVDNKDCWFKESALHLVVKRGSLSILKVLLNNNTNMESKDYLRRTPLIYAVENGYKEKVNLLLENGANVGMVDDVTCNSALFVAAKSGHTEILKNLLKHNSDPNIIRDIFLQLCPQSLELMKVILPFIKNINEKDSKGNTVLHLASKRGYSKIVKLLLDNNCNINSINDAGYSSFYLSCIHFKYRVVHILLQAGCDRYTEYKKTPDRTTSLLNIILSHKWTTQKQNQIKNKVKTIAILVDAGYNLTNDTDTKETIHNLFNSSVPMIAKHRKFFERLQFLTQQPISLKEACLNYIKTLLRSKYDDKSQNLEIPDYLQRLLLYEHF